MIRYSIAICTYNRSDLLANTLASLAVLVGIRDPDVEVVIVDNASTDSTAQVVASFENRLPIHYCTESQQGHCYARNRASRTAHGEWILWTDDDVELDSQWLVAYRQAIADHPRHVFFGGLITPKFLAPAPRWIQSHWEQLAGCYAARDLGPTPFELHRAKLPYGANFAVRQDLCCAYPFDVALGRKGQNLMGEDERDFMLRLLDAGYRGQWVPAARVNHLIPKERLELGYLERYFRGQAAVQSWRGLAPKFSELELEQAVWHHLWHWRIRRWIPFSDSWLDHWIKLAMFQQWLEMQRAASDTSN